MRRLRLGPAGSSKKFGGVHVGLNLMLVNSAETGLLPVQLLVCNGGKGDAVRRHAKGEIPWLPERSLEGRWVG